MDLLFTFGIEDQSKWAKIVALVQVVENKPLEVRFVGEKNPWLTNNLETFNSYFSAGEKNIVYFFFSEGSEAPALTPNFFSRIVGRETLSKKLSDRDIVSFIIFQNFVMVVQ